MKHLITLIFSLTFAMPVLALDSKMSLDRRWGLLVGDQIEATIELPVNVAELDIHSLPQHEKRYGPWLMLHELSMQGKQIKLNFQLINVPAENRKVATPEFSLRTKQGDFITVPSVPMQIGSFLQNKEGESSWIPRADAKLPTTDLSRLYGQLWLSLSVLVLSVLVWLAWHLGLRPRQRLPFAAALLELNKMRFLGRKDADEASRSLHHAFNRSAGRVVIHSQLDKLWEKCAWLEPEKAEIESFYQQSAAHFFSPNADKPKDFNQILTLARACRAREKMA